MARLDSESMAEWRVRQKILLAGVQEDPLCVEKWHALLDAEEQHCQGGADESLLRLYRQATRVLSCDGNVDNELYLRIWIGYAKQQMKVNVEDALETFRFLESRNIGDHYALRFKEWAKLELHAGYRTKALQVLKKGLTLRAMPVSELHRQFLDIYSAEKTKGGTPVRGKGAPNPSTGEVETGEGRLQVAEVGNQSSQSASVASPVAPAVNSNIGGSDTSSSCETQDAVHDMPQPCSNSPTEEANVHSGTITSHARKFPKRLKPLGPPLRVARGDPEVPNESAVPGEPAPSFIYGSVEPSKDHQFFSPPLASNLESQKRVSNGAAVEPESIGDLRKRKAESPPSQGDTSQLVSGLTNAEERYPTCSSPATKDDVGHSQMSWVVNNSSSAVKETSSLLNQGAILDEVNKPTSVADVKEIEQFNVNALHERFLSFRKQQGVTGGSPMKDGNLSNARQSQQLDTSRATQEYLGTGRPTNHTSEGTVKENVAAGCAEVDVLSHSLGSIALLDKDGNGEDHNRHLHVEDLNTAPTSGVAGPSPLAGPVVTSDGEQQFQKLIPSPGHRVQNRQKPRVSSHNSSELKVFRDKAFVENGNSQPRHTSADSHGVVNASTRQPLRDRNLNKLEGKVVAAQQPPRKAQENEAFVVVNNKRYQKLGKIGSGGSSEVFKVIDADCSIFALKRIHLRGKDHTSACGFYQEIEYLERLHGKRHIIRLVDYEVTNKKVLDGSGSIGDRIKEDGTIYMVLEYGEIDLAGMLAEKRKESKEILDENWLRLYWQHVLEAVETIHDERIVHSDLKPANFLMVKGELKLIDFGIAKAIQSDTTNIVRDNQMGTVNYMSPEALLQNTVTDDGELVKVGRASDIWSLGCILYQMVYGQTPFSHLSFYAKIKEITNPNQRINYPPVSNFWLLDAMKKCLCWDPHKRLRIPELLVHPFLRPDLAPQGPIPRGLNGCEIHPEELEQLVLQVQNLPLTSVTQFKSQVLGLLYAKLAGRSDC